jgi:hypothetical protein
LAPTNTPAAEGTDLSARIERVESGLIGLTKDGQVLSDKPMMLAERMKHYNVPGASIAVINDYQMGHPTKKKMGPLSNVNIRPTANASGGLLVYNKPREI